ncbi:unnamed protein product [Gordionus sp. m RMFG-2023]
MYFLQNHIIPIIIPTTYHSIHLTKSHLPPICLPPASYQSNHSSNNIPFRSFDQIPSATHLPITIHHHPNPISLQDPYISISSRIIPFQSLVQQHTIPFIRPNPICLPFAHYHSSSSHSHYHHHHSPNHYPSCLIHNTHHSSSSPNPNLTITIVNHFSITILHHPHLIHHCPPNHYPSCFIHNPFFVSLSLYLPHY